MLKTKPLSVFDEVNLFFDQASDRLELNEGLRQMLKQPWRELQAPSGRNRVGAAKGQVKGHPSPRDQIFPAATDLMRSHTIEEPARQSTTTSAAGPHAPVPFRLPLEERERLARLRGYQVQLVLPA